MHDHDRAAWERHPNFHSLAGLLLGIHDSFRHAADRLSRQVRDGAPSDARRSFRPLAETLHHHHRLEEELLFPAVASIASDFPSHLVGDHRTLTDTIDRVAKALEGSEAREMEEAVIAFASFLGDHLDREEALVVPILLAMDREQMQRFFGGW